ncbi:MAG: M1 family metallopeptidase [Candidatus Thorarchaeota archaeon]|nr:M1 family metallopeptidase [Candidatus Thorarchaeota archaeon]
MTRVLYPVVALICILLTSTFSSGLSLTVTNVSDIPSANKVTLADNYDDFSQGDFTDVNFSRVTLSLSLDEETATVNGSMHIDFYNGDPIPFNSIPFHLYTSGMMYETRKGSITINSIESAGSSPEVTDHNVLSDQNLLWVNIASPVQPGEFVSFEINFTTVMPDGEDRSGFYGNDAAQTRIYTFSSSYPIPCVYDQYDGWNTDPYSDVGDPFYFDMAFYDLFVEVPNGMVVAATGEVDAQTTADGRTRYYYEIPSPVREVTFSASRYYIVESTLHNGVNVSTFFLPASASLWEDDSLDQAVQSLDLFNTTLGIYPYSTLNVVEQHAYYGGMEYPCQVYVTRVISATIQEGTRVFWYLELVIVHEIAHQWWSQLVGDDCVDWGFLDEGLTCWAHSYYGEYYYDDWEYFQYYRYLDSVRFFFAQYGSGVIINESNAVRPDLTGHVDYIQTPLILEKLRKTIGHDMFISGLQLFFRELYFGIATLNNLQTAFEDVYGGNLDWFFFPWFDNPYLPLYEIENAQYEVTTTTLTFNIIDLNEHLNPNEYSQQIPVTVYDSQDNILVDQEVWVNGTTTISWQLTASPDLIVLDYSDYIIVQLSSESQDSYEYGGLGISVLYPIDPIMLTISVSVVVAIPLIVYYLKKKR